MEYRILGPLAVLAGGHELSLGGLKQRRILALLLLHPGRPVDVARLAAWGEHVPATGRRQVQNAIGALRALYHEQAGYAERAIAVTTDSGFRILEGRARACGYSEMLLPRPAVSALRRPRGRRPSRCLPIWACPRPVNWLTR